MSRKSAINIVGIAFLYILFAAVVYVLPVSALGATGDQDQATFLAIFRHNALDVIGISFTCMAVWFALGEWFIPAWSPPGRWHLAWAILFVIVLGASIAVCFHGPRGGSSDPVNYSVATYYVLGGAFSFYLASVLFSPSNAQYTIWPAKNIRRGW
jgi:hypothetical protein